MVLMMDFLRNGFLPGMFQKHKPTMGSKTISKDASSDLYLNRQPNEQKLERIITA